MGREIPNKPPEVNEFAIRAKSLVTTGAITGAIGLAGTLALAYFKVGVPTIAGFGAADYLLGTNMVGTAAGVSAIIPVAAAVGGGLYGALTADKKILQAKAEARREWMQARAEEARAARYERALPGVSDAQGLENERHRDMMGMGAPGGLPLSSALKGGRGGLFNS